VATGLLAGCPTMVVPFFGAPALRLPQRGPRCVWLCNTRALILSIECATLYGIKRRAAGEALCQ